MAILPLPQRGQPLDLGYISQVASAINQLSDAQSSSNYNFVSIIGTSVGTQNIPITETKVVGAYKEIYKSVSVQASSQQTFDITFDTDFKFAPIVTATPVNILGTDAGDDVTLVIDSITTSKISGVIKFKTTGVVSIGVNVIAIGIPV